MLRSILTPEKYENPLSVPTEGVFDSPTVVLCLNVTWVSILSGLIDQLDTTAIWEGTDEEIDAAIQEVRKLQIALAPVSDCP